MNYTKEKWERDDNCIYALNKNGTNRFYASVHRGKNDGDVTIEGEEAIANAHLIAAAPNMHEALKAVLPWAEEWIKYLRANVGIGQGKGANEVFDNARKALAKAEGK